MKQEGKWEQGLAVVLLAMFFLFLSGCINSPEQKIIAPQQVTSIIDANKNGIYSTEINNQRNVAMISDNYFAVASGWRYKIGSAIVGDKYSHAYNVVYYETKDNGKNWHSVILAQNNFDNSYPHIVVSKDRKTVAVSWIEINRENNAAIIKLRHCKIENDCSKDLSWENPISFGSFKWAPFNQIVGAIDFDFDGKLHAIFQEDGNLVHGIIDLDSGTISEKETVIIGKSISRQGIIIGKKHIDLTYIKNDRQLYYKRYDNGSKKWGEDILINPKQETTWLATDEFDGTTYFVYTYDNFNPFTNGQIGGNNYYYKKFSDGKLSEEVEIIKLKEARVANVTATPNGWFVFFDETPRPQIRNPPNSDQNILFALIKEGEPIKIFELLMQPKSQTTPASSRFIDDSNKIIVIYHTQEFNSGTWDTLRSIWVDIYDRKEKELGRTTSLIDIKISNTQQAIITILERVELI